MTSNFPICKSIPHACHQNSIFVIDSSSLKHIDDVKSDMNGVYKAVLEIKKKKVKLCSSIKVLHNVYNGSYQDLEEDERVMRVHRRQNCAGLVQNIVYFGDNRQEISKNKIMQYFVNTHVAGDTNKVDFAVKPHGNAKSPNSFYPLKRSTLCHLKEAISCNKRPISAVYEEAHRVPSVNADYGDLPRSKKQLIDLADGKRHTSPGNKIGELVVMSAELDGFVWYHADIPTEVIVLGENEMRNARSCKEDAIII